MFAFHPLVAEWFTNTIGTPTDAQRRGWASIRNRQHTLIAAPTGSGKTLAAFLTALDDLFQEGLTRTLPDEVRVIYVSPLKALSADIHKNLAEPRRGIRTLAEDAGLQAPRITAAVRTGDTTQTERAAMLRTPPHILVTTPESLYLLLTAERSREMLRTAHTVIVDEIHAVIGTRRGAHLALTLERLQQVVPATLVRIGLSATQKPIEEVGRFLAGAGASACAIQSGPLHEGHEVSAPPAEPECPAERIVAARPVHIVDQGHYRNIDLDIEIPRSPLEAVMSHEVWEEYYDRLTQLIEAHHTTLVFVNTRRLAERLARHLTDRLGDQAVTAHHGSLSKEKRLDAETRLKDGGLKALVATASLELGIDIGHVDLVCQIGSPHRIATLLQRVGRSGHRISGLPKGRVFPLSRDDLVECAAMLQSVRRGELDAIVSHDAPLDVLAQQVVAEVACRDYGDDELFTLVRRAWPYRDLRRSDFDAVLAMTAEGFATRRGRRGALVHRDEINGRVRGRRGARLLAITSGGAIPEVADYRVVLDPDETFIGTLNEDFAIESAAGDIFQLGNSSWRVLQVATGIVRVADAKGAPPTIPFWFGEAPARSDELSRAVSDLRADIDRLLEAGLPPPRTALRQAAPEQSEGGKAATEAAPSMPDTGVKALATEAAPPIVDAGLKPCETEFLDDVTAVAQAFRPALQWLVDETGIPHSAAEQIISYLAETRRALGVIPTQQTLVLERFFDESGGMQLVLHAPFGSRVNKAWGLALRKRFCRQFNFELQAAASEDALLLSLGPQHSFPLSDVFRYLHPATARDVLVQAFLDAPVFQTRWRWNTTISLAVPRNRKGRKVPPQLQRMQADDLMAAVFPDAAACLENIPGDRTIPDHPLVNQTVRDCLEEAMDYDALAGILARIHRGELTLISRDTPEPSPLAHEILNARPYSFLDDAPLEERRTQAVYTRRVAEPSGAADLGALDQAAIDRVRGEARPDPRTADELHDVLLTTGYLTEHDTPAATDLFAELVAAKRAARVRMPNRSADRAPVLVAAERLPELFALHPGAQVDPPIQPPASRTARVWTRDEALVELLRGRLTILGPIATGAIAQSLAVTGADAENALVSLESEGVVLRGTFETSHARTAKAAEGRSLPEFATGAARQPVPLEWCDRRLLARIHRYTLNRLRAEIEPVTPAVYMRFLFTWQHVDRPARLSGVDGLRSVIAVLDGFELAAASWERSVLPARMDRYDHSLLDMLCLTGEIGWARLSAPNAESGLVSTTPIALFLREHESAWFAGAWTPERIGAFRPVGAPTVPKSHAIAVLEALHARGALFFHELAAVTGLDDGTLRAAIADLVSAGLITSDGFAGLRAILEPARRHGAAGRWSAVVPSTDWASLTASADASGKRGHDPIDRKHVGGARPDRTGAHSDLAIEIQARALLRRYGIVFRRVLTREVTVAPWRELTRVYRRLEARGEIRGGRFVAGMSGEQFALPDVVGRLREIRRTPPDGRLVTLSAADPLNLAGIVTAGDRIHAVGSNRVVYRDGVPLAVLEGEFMRPLAEISTSIAAEVATALTGRPMPPVLSGYVG
jgi:ATP-dependent helicase Lhr and Lhr-like helicase